MSGDGEPGWLEALSGFTEYVCFTVACVGCGAPHTDMDDNTLHFPTRAAAVLHAYSTEHWGVGPEGMWCPQCYWDAYAAERAASVDGGLR
ncbi:hypothetical protein Ae717Ps2_4250c [Pseudonocardia sp. Ae717_Ps2]|uniref:hypothetical protein n=1 Tax=Pseudonocardia sp. Ae717_Ps2 TaxID=1885573 RepID=UPI00094AEDA4|nr:hypothetical protein [Pseudonocardia sp. Ae717_Ps2]OLM33354.1 hypothetical protein Ae717Ps2_4250c [Pseudonocardia sp. Ae717_Ps2]